MALRREPVSIVCVFNSPEVRRGCLDRSIDEHRPSAPETEYLPVDNVDSAFTTAGGALNHGARLARNDYLVFVHQDVYLHSLQALEQAAGWLADDASIGVIGAIGIAADGRLVGTIRDRVVLLGESASSPSEVDSVDEVLFVVRRSDLLAEPLSELPELAWHAYGVEYGLRMRSLGKRVTAMDLAITHNSLTINLARLDEAHARVGAAYPAALPVRTTCGTISSATAGSARQTFLKAHRWRYPWLKESLIAHRARRGAGGGRFVLSDIRRDIDQAIASRPETLVVANLIDDPSSFCEQPVTVPADGGSRSATTVLGGLDLVRKQQPVELASLPRTGLPELLGHWLPSTSMLISNLAEADLAVVASTIPTAQRLAGYHEGIGWWLLLGPVLANAPEQWRSARATPFGMRALPAG